MIFILLGNKFVYFYFIFRYILFYFCICLVLNSFGVVCCIYIVFSVRFIWDCVFFIFVLKCIVVFVINSVWLFLFIYVWGMYVLLGGSSFKFFCIYWGKRFFFLIYINIFFNVKLFWYFEIKFFWLWVFIYLCICDCWI